MNMNSSRNNVLIVEDDLIVCTNLEVILADLGYNIAGISDNAVDALVNFSVKKPDIVICDIGLKGSTDGIELVKKMNQINKVPVLFLTAHQEEPVFLKAKSVGPFAFINKPIDRKQLERSVALAMEHAHEASVFTTAPNPASSSLYTRVGNKLKKINVSEIEYVEVDGKYSSISIGPRQFNCKISLKELVEKLPFDRFIQINRNSIINLDKIEDIDLANFTVKMPTKEISISRTFKDQLLDRINVI
jgi:DNA-binding LytR/AlgR family response regulator